MTMRFCPRIAAAVGALAATTVVLAACNSTPSSTGTSSTTPSGATSSTAGAAPVNVVASTNVWADIAKQVGGGHVNVTSIMSDPNADPHEFEADAKTAAALSKAQFVIENGLGYDDFMDKLLAASPNSSRVVLNAADVMQIAGPDANPHIWYEIAKIPAVASGIADQLGKIDPSDAATFTANAKTFNDSLGPINAAIANIKAKYPGAPVGYTERVPGYLVEAAGLKLATPASFAQSIEDGNDPSPADNAAMDSALTDKKIKVLLYNGQVTSPATDAVKQRAQQSGVPVVGVTETLPPTDKDFQDWQLRQINELTTALGG
ncbi:MAG TPA: zinc ABC transporter substrate-binding protein [Mycobacterium sp.]|nr:zinc ABC transporter substrate-binding protein [Mycobacterium sp.]